MNMNADGLALSWIVGSLAVLFGLLVWAIRTAPWYKVQDDRGAQHVLLGATVIVFFTWQLGASLGEGVTFHFLLMTTLTLMFGPQFALLSMSLALLGVTIQSDLGFLAFGVNALLMGGVPIMLTWWMARWAYRVLDRNFFVFVLFNAFLSSALGAVLSLGLASMVMLANEIYTFETLSHDFIPYIPLLAMPEGFVNGMLMMAFVLFKPEWVSAFNDQEYFK